MSFKYVITLTCFLILLGCKSSKEVSVVTKWNITLISPSGKSETYTKSSSYKPEPVPQISGHTTISNYDWEDEIIAPVGWHVKIEKFK